MAPRKIDLRHGLRGRGERGRRALIRTLRQCGGARLRYLLLVRDDSWLGVSRFVSEPDVDSMQRPNAELVDLFDISYALKAFADFGWFYGGIGTVPTASEQVPLERAVDGEAREDKVAPMRLVLFAETVKARTWPPNRIEQSEPVAVSTSRRISALPPANTPRRCRSAPPAAFASSAAICDQIYPRVQELSAVLVWATLTRYFQLAMP